MWRVVLVVALILSGLNVTAVEAQGADCPAGTHAAVAGDRQVLIVYQQICVPDDPPEVAKTTKGGNKGSYDFGCEVTDAPDHELTACSSTVFMGSDLPALARSVAARLNLPRATPQFSPDPQKNEWKMLAVGFPVWLTTPGPRRKVITTTAQGLALRLSADLASTTFTMGDGSQVTCTTMTAYTSSVKAGSPSPTCGHIYTKPSLPKGSYTVTATANWTINWSVDGISGTFPMSYSDSAPLPIGELRALNR